MIPEKTKEEFMKKVIQLVKQGPEISPTSKMIAAKIESLRVTLGWNQEELAKKVGLSRASIVNIEQGRQNLTLANIEKFCIVFNVTPKHLMRGIWF